MNYKHTYIDGSDCGFPVGKVVCVGRNYDEHIRELHHPVPAEPIFFIKPATSVVSISEKITIPEYSDNCHHETELAVLFGSVLTRADRPTAEKGIVAYGIGLDLTLRDIQRKMKQNGYPWEVAKAFDGACPLSPFVKKEAFEDPQDTTLKLVVNGETRQESSTRRMIRPIFDLVSAASRFFTLAPGDVMLTGTPAGVSKLGSGDQLELELAGTYRFQTSVR